MPACSKAALHYPEPASYSLSFEFGSQAGQLEVEVYDVVDADLIQALAFIRSEVAVDKTLTSVSVILFLRSCR